MREAINAKKGLALLLSLAMVLSLLILPLPAEAGSAEYDTAGATTFTFSDSGISVTAGDYDGYKIEGTALTINDSGTYVVKGSCSDGSIKVKKGTTGVTLVLDGLNLTSVDTAPIACNKSTEVSIVAASGTSNVLTDTELNNDETHTDNANAENAVIKCKDGSKVTLTGGGTLTVNSYGKNGIKGGDTTEEDGESYLRVEKLTLNINANAGDALKSDRLLEVLSGNITISADDDAIASDYVLNIGASGTTGPTIVIEKSSEGIEAATVNIYSGDITVNATDDGINAANSDLTDYDFACNIYGGSIYLNVSAGDGVDSNGALNIAGGKVEVYTSEPGRDGAPLDCDGVYTLTGGTVLAVGSSSMAQSPNGTPQAYVVFGSGGTAGFGGGQGGPQGQGGFDPQSATSGGAMQPPQGGFGGQNGQQGMPGGQPPAGTSGSTMAPPQGTGSNGMPGGTMTPPQGAGNRNNGTAMQGGSQNGGQGGPTFAAADTGVSISAGQSIQIVDADGNVLYTGKAQRSANYVFFSSADLTAGDTYTLKAGGTAVTTAVATAEGSSRVGMFGGNGNQGMPGAQAGNTSGSAVQQNAASGDAAQQSTGSGSFSDVAAGAYYKDAVDWAVKNKVTSGTGSGTFSPAASCTRAQMVTFLWRAAGSPEPSDTSLQFSDVKSTDYFWKAVCWAAENGITKGVSDTKFGASDTVDRSQAVTFLYRLAGGKASGDSSFKDVSADSYYSDAVRWAVANGITAGTAADSFSPSADCQRAQIVTFLYRYYGK